MNVHLITLKYQPNAASIGEGEMELGLETYPDIILNAGEV